MIDTPWGYMVGIGSVCIYSVGMGDCRVWGGRGLRAERLALPHHKIFNHQNHLYYTFDIQYILSSR
jgi:hypothetical protein